jgi:hypothetical protein
MKIELTKKGMTRYCQPQELEMMQSAGWAQASASQEQAGEEIIRLKPPVKSKATATAVEEANINIQGDE